MAEAYGRRASATGPVPSRLASPGDLFMLQEREWHVARVLRRVYPGGLATLNILDFGCGAGWDLLELLSMGSQSRKVVGVDLLGDRLHRARQMLPSAALARADGAALPFPDATFDLVLQYTVFSSILDQGLRRNVATELGRVLRPRGSVLWYDIRVDNPRNPDIRRVTRSELDGLFPGWRVDARSITLAPPLARRLARVNWLAAAIGATLPFLRTHLLARIMKPE